MYLLKNIVSNLEDLSLTNNGFEDKINNINKMLLTLYEERKLTELELNQHILKRLNQESMYNNNMSIINNHINKIQIDINEFINSIQINNITPEETLKNMETIIDFSNILINKYNNKKSMLEYIGIGAQTRIDYNLLMNNNKNILEQIEYMKEIEKPFEYKLKKIDEKITNLNKEINLIKNFKIELSSINNNIK